MIASTIRRGVRTAALLRARLQHRHDIERLNSLRAQLDALRVEETFATLAAIVSSRRLAKLDEQQPEQENYRVV